MITNINSEDRLVQETFANFFEHELGWDSVYAWTNETFGPQGLLGRSSERDVVLVRDLRAAVMRLNPDKPDAALEQAIDKLSRTDHSRSLLQHNREFYSFIRNGVPVEWKDANGTTKYGRVKVIDFRNPENNRFLAVRELKVQGLRMPHYNRRLDLACFVNGLPVVVFELKAVYRNIRAGFDDNLTDYLSETSISHTFHHNAFLVVSNGDAARYGSITSKWEHFAEWKRNDEKDKGSLAAKVLLEGMMAKERLLDILENFILFDDSRAGGTRKIVARNQQVLGVNNAVASVLYQEQLKREFPKEERTISYSVPLPERLRDARDRLPQVAEDEIEFNDEKLPLIMRAHDDLGRLGVFWHTQGSGKSYSMVFFAEKVRRMVEGNFTFVVMTDREDLDDQLWRTFIGCGVTDENTPRASSGKQLKELLQGTPRFVFSLIHKFNQPVIEPYSTHDDIIVISDEAHRTQAGKFARNMRLALPYASFIGFTGTPLFKHDELTRRIFGDYISRYDFKRSEEDGSTVKLVYENRGEKLGIARKDLNDRIADAVEKADLDPDQTALLEKLLGKDYEVITADDRLEKLATDFVEHASRRWETGKSMLVCIDKVTCGRMYESIIPKWKVKLQDLKNEVPVMETVLATSTDGDEQERLTKELAELKGRVAWMESTIIEIIISEAQNEVRDFQKWGVDIIPHRDTMKRGFKTDDGKRVPVEDAFRDPDHPFRIAIVCAMWLTGFDVESLATLYIDKPMKAHNLMQAIARANRVYPGKDCGVIVDYNGMLKSLREALAQYALGEDGDGEEEIVEPIEERVAALIEAIEAAENHLRSLGFDPDQLKGSTGFDRIEALKDAVDAVYTSDESKRRYEIMVRVVFNRFKSLLMEPSALIYAERHDNLEAIYKKLQEKRDTADVTAVLKALHRIVNEAIQTAEPGEDHATGITIDLSEIDFDQLRNEFAMRVHRKHAALQDIREVVEEKLAKMLQVNPLRMDYYKKYQEIIAEYNREKDRATVEETFARLVQVANSLDEEERRAAEEGLSEQELALFDLLFKDDITKKEREGLKQASRDLLAAVNQKIQSMPAWIENTSTQAEIRVFILDQLYATIPMPPFSDEETEAASEKVYEYIWQTSVSAHGYAAA